MSTGQNPSGSDFPSSPEEMSAVGKRRGQVVRGGHNERHLPEELAMEILSRLPQSSSIARCRCVSKSWRRLLSDPKFIGNIILSSGAQDPHLMIVRPDVNTAPSSYSIHSYDDMLRPVSSGTLPRAAGAPPDTEYVFHAGCCNGICCIVRGWGREIILWNPTTSETKLLPPATGLIPPCYNLQFGFGFDRETNDYKVVCTCDQSESDQRGGGTFWLYSLKKNSWRQLLDNIAGAQLRPDYERVHRRASSRNERCHWWCPAVLYPGAIAYYCRYCELISFDMSREAFAWLRLPSPRGQYDDIIDDHRSHHHDHPYGWGFVQSLSMPKDESCLVAVYAGKGGCLFDVWAALDYVALAERKCSWMKLYSVDCGGGGGGVRVPNFSSKLTVAGLRKHGRMFAGCLCFDGDELRVIDLETGNSDVDHGVIKDEVHVQLVNYAPSTMSLSSDFQSQILTH